MRMLWAAAAPAVILAALAISFLSPRLPLEAPTYPQSFDLQCRPGADCVTVERMVPPVRPTASHSAAVTAQLTPDDRAAFEHLLVRALAGTAAVQWATREFAKRMRRIVVGAAAINGTSAQDALLAAFAPPW
jgi:hypothetical protein